MELPSVALFYRPHIIQEAIDDRLRSFEEVEYLGLLPSEESTLDFLLSERPSVIVVDLALPENNGESSNVRFNHLRRYKTQVPRTEIVVVSEQDNLSYCIRSVRIGAKGYVRATSKTAAVMNAVSNVLIGDFAVPKDMQRYLLSEIHDTDGRKIAYGVETLTDRELEVFQLMGEGLKSKEIAERIYLAKKTVETHRRRIKDKLQIDSLLKLYMAAFEFRFFDMEASNSSV